MSPYERIMLFGVAAVSFAYLVFYTLMTDGMQLGNRSSMFMAVSLLGFMAVVAISTFLTSYFSKLPSGSLADEREIRLDSLASGLGYHALEMGVFVVLLLAIFESAAGPHALGSFGLGRPEGIVFWLVSVNAAAGIVRLGGAFFLSRRG